MHLHLDASLQDIGIALMQCARTRRIVDTLARRKGLPKSSHDAVLLSEVWMRLAPHLPFRDTPENIYSLVWRIAEFAAFDLRREIASKEVLESDMSDNERELVIENHSDSGSILSSTEDEIDQRTARKRFSEKLQRVGWDPQASPATYRGITRPGRKLKIVSEETSI